MRASKNASAAARTLGRQGLAHGEDAADAQGARCRALAVAADGIEIVGIDHQAVGLEFREMPDLLGDVDIGGNRLERAGLEQQVDGCPPMGPHPDRVIVDPDGGESLGEIASGPGMEAQADGAPEELADGGPPDGHRLAGGAGGAALPQRLMALGHGRAVEVRPACWISRRRSSGRRRSPSGVARSSGYQPGRRQPAGEMRRMRRRMGRQTTSWRCWRASISAAGSHWLSSSWRARATRLARGPVTMGGQDSPGMPLRMRESRPSGTVIAGTPGEHPRQESRFSGTVQG